MIRVWGRLALVFLIAGLAHAAQAATAGQVAYRLTPNPTAKVPHVEVELRFRGEADGFSLLRVPQRFAAERDLDKNLSGISVSGGQLEQTPRGLGIAHKPGASLKVSYRIVSGRSGPPRRGMDLRPDVSAQGFHLIGETAFIYPDGGLKRPASFRFGRMPRGWTAASDLQDLDDGSVAELLESVVLAGPDVRIEKREVAGAVLRVAVSGRFAFTDAALADRVASILALQRNFWSEPPGPYFAALAPLPPDPVVSRQAGLNRGDAAVFYATPRPSAPPERALRGLSEIIAHELAHAWIARKLGGLPRGEAEPGAYWFSEGFSDFFGRRVLLAAGLWSLADYAEALSTPVPVEIRATPNGEIARRYWSDPSLEDAPYRQGRALALFWDDRLRRATGGQMSLDDVLLAQLVEAKRSELTADALFLSTYARISGFDLAEDVTRHLGEGQSVAWPGDLYSGCLALRRLGDGYLAVVTAKTPEAEAECVARIVGRLAGT
jgi:predicted metalloprotease with PDZ domain